MPRLPTFAARWALEDPRGRPYLVFWTTEDGSLRYPVRMRRIEGGRAVRVTKPSGANQRLELLRRPSPNGTGTMLLYRCPICEKPRRYLYRLAASGGRLVDYFGLQCQDCAGLRWASQGRYRGRLERTLGGVLAGIYGQSVSQSIPRDPWDPRAVSDPRIVVAEFPEELLEAGGVPREHPSRQSHRSARTDYLDALITASETRSPQTSPNVHRSVSMPPRAPCHGAGYRRPQCSCPVPPVPTDNLAHPGSASSVCCVG